MLYVYENLKKIKIKKTSKKIIKKKKSALPLLVPRPPLLWSVVAPLKMDRIENV